MPETKCLAPKRTPTTARAHRWFEAERSRQGENYGGCPKMKLHPRLAAGRKHGSLFY